MNHFENCYAVLGVGAEASHVEIREAWLRLVRVFHPDNRPSHPLSEEMVRRVNEAYETLRDPTRRAEHDRILRTISEEQIQLDESLVERSFLASESMDFACERCGRVDSTLRFRSYVAVVGYLVSTWKNTYASVLCSKCWRIKQAASFMATAVLGWWGIPEGPVWTVSALRQNMDGCRGLSIHNVYLLDSLAGKFYRRMNYDEARRCIDERLKIRDSEAARRFAALVVRRTIERNGRRSLPLQIFI